MKSEDRQIINNLFEFVKKQQLNESSGHDWFHTYRVYLNSILISKSEQNVDNFVLEASSLLHDIADHKFGYSDNERKKIIKDILINFKVDMEKVKIIVSIIDNISFANKNKTKGAERIECKIIQDADRLDAIGAIGIARTFAYGGFVNRMIFNEKNDNSDTISHFYDKLFKLKDGMNTELGKKMAKERHEFMERYIREFYIEWFGEIKGKKYYQDKRN